MPGQLQQPREVYVERIATATLEPPTGEVAQHATQALSGACPVVINEKVQQIADAKLPAKKTAPKWEQDAREHLRIAIRKFAKPLSDLLDRDANEGDPRLLITDFLCEGLGF